MSGPKVKVGNSWKDVKDPWAKINGTWRKITDVRVKVDGVWKDATGRVTWTPPPTPWVPPPEPEPEAPPVVLPPKEEDPWVPPPKFYYDTPQFITYAAMKRGERFTFTVEAISGAHYEVQSRYNEGTWSKSFFFSKNTGELTANTSVTNSSLQLRVRAVSPTYHENESKWREGPVRTLGAVKLDKPTGFSYPTSITRDDQITIKWTKESGVTYVVKSIYNGSTNNTIYTGTGSSKVYDVSAKTDYNTLQFEIKATKAGYIDSDWVTGTKVNLKDLQLATVGTIKAPKPYLGETITVTWTAVSKAEKYQLELQYNDGDWKRVYWGSNKTYTGTVLNQSAKTIQWRIRATAANYADGAWKYTTQTAVDKPPLKVSTWTATDTTSWRSNWGWRDPFDTDQKAKLKYVYQGAWNSPPYWGNHKGLAFFNYSSIQKTLKGKDIEKVRVYFYRINAGGIVAGQSIKLWTHNYASKPSGNPTLKLVQGPFSSFARGEGKWITVKNEVAERIRDGTAKGIALYREDENGYLYMSSTVKIEVSYR